MTAQVEFYCTAEEEQEILIYLTASSQVSVFLLDGRHIAELPSFTPRQLPPWPEFVCLYIWSRDLGALQWHNQRPKLTGPSHMAFVSRFFARQQWDDFGLAKGNKLLDQEMSPGICYKRPEQHD